MSASEGLKHPASPNILEKIVAKALAPVPLPRAISPSSLSGSGAQDSDLDESAASPPVAARTILPRTVHKSPQAFRTISEVADDLGVPQHVLRFWETKFSSIRPLKRGGGRRYYRPEDVNLLKRIHHLLYTEGYTIKGAQKFLKASGRSVLTPPASGEEGRGSVAGASFVGLDLKDATQDNDQKQGLEGQASGVSGSYITEKKGETGSLSLAQREGLQAVLAELVTLRTLLAAARA